MIAALLLIFLQIPEPCDGFHYVPHPSRSSRVVRAFEKQTDHVGGWKGHVADHVVPLCAGGEDATGNMQWQTVADAKVKDRWEKSLCADLRKADKFTGHGALHRAALIVLPHLYDLAVTEVALRSDAGDNIREIGPLMQSFGARLAVKSLAIGATLFVIEREARTNPGRADKYAAISGGMMFGVGTWNVVVIIRTGGQ